MPGTSLVFPGNFMVSAGLVFSGSSRCNWLWILLILLVLSGCSTPIGTRTAEIRETYEHITQNALTADTYSSLSAQVLHRYHLRDLYEKDPDQAIVVLHDIACVDNRHELLYALSELSFLAGSRSGSQPGTGYYLSSAAYAYFYLFRQIETDTHDPYGRRLRVVSDLYNAALAHVIDGYKEQFTDLSGNHALPAGRMALTIHTDFFPYQLTEMEKILPADKLTVYGLSVRDRFPGLGAPFIAVAKPQGDIPVEKSYPGTFFLRVEGGIRDLATAGKGKVELYSPYEVSEVKVNKQDVPLETDLTVQLAYNLNHPFFWDIGRLQFLRGAVVKSGVYPLQPYLPGRIPVVFVHGTFSTPARWAEMINTLWSDPLIRRRFQFWCYLYDSGKPIVLSSTNLREKLTAMITRFDPEGKEDALREVVVVGHSQGGLLTKLTAVDTGDQLIQSLTGKTLDELNLTNEKTKEVVKKYLIYEPLPFVSRVVFISTPHRGSYLAGHWVRNLVKDIITLPVTLMKKTRAIAHAAEEIGIDGVMEIGDLTTSIDGMSPENPGLLALADIPLAPEVKGHSIIPIKGDDKPPEGDDGVVKYTSAHIPYVESELIVEDEHSCQSNPFVIEEVRRILLEHLDQYTLSRQKEDEGS